VVSRSLPADQGQEPRVGELLKRTEQRIPSRRGISRSLETAPPASLRTTYATRQRLASCWEAPVGVPGHGACSGCAATTRTGRRRQGAPVEGTPRRAGAHGRQACAA